MSARSRQPVRSQMFDWLRLKGYVAFDMPHAVTALGMSLLLGIAVTTGYVLISRPELPAVFVAYTGLVGVGCLSVAAAMRLGRAERVSKLAWFFGDMICITSVALYVGTRPAVLPGFATVTGRWDFAPGTLAGALALAFVAVHASVLLGINVAYPRRQHWSD